MATMTRMPVTYERARLNNMTHPYHIAPAAIAYTIDMVTP